MFDPVAGAYYVLSKIKENYPESRKFIFDNPKGKQLLKDLSEHKQTSDTRQYIGKINMKVPIVKGSDVRSRQVVLSLNDVFQLLAVWQWLQDLNKGNEVDGYADDIKYLAKIISYLEKKIDAVDTRKLKTGIGFSYVANMENCTNFLSTESNTDADSLRQAYKTRTNLVLKYYLDNDPIFEEVN